ncbi:MAG: hypothetical protein ACR2OO_02325, partial [Thermomicrobiales bacterium]
TTRRVTLTIAAVYPGRTLVDQTALSEITFEQGPAAQPTPSPAETPTETPTDEAQAAPADAGSPAPEPGSDAPRIVSAGD